MLRLRVYQILKEQNKTAYWLAKRIGMSQNNMGKICNGETTTIRFDTIEKICKELNCSIDDLFETDDPQLKLLLAYTSKINDLQASKSDTE